MEPKTVLEDRLMQVARYEPSESTVKAILWAVRLAEKLGWIARMVQMGDWYLVAVAELERSKEEHAAAKEWAQIDITNMARKAGMPTEWLCWHASRQHIASGDEKQYPWGRGTDKVQYRGTKSRRGA